MSEWTIIPDAASENYQPPALTYVKKYRRKSISTLNEQSVEGYSNELQVSVLDNDNRMVYDVTNMSLMLFEESSDTIQSNQTINKGNAPAPLTTLYSDPGIIAYQWYVHYVDGFFRADSAIIGATSEEYQPPILEWSRWYVRFNIREYPESTTVTNIVKITVMEDGVEHLELGILLPGTIQSSQTIQVGETPNELITDTPASNNHNLDSIGYVWEESINGTDWYNPGGNGYLETRQPSALVYSRWYRRTANQSSFLTGVSNTIKITVMDNGVEQLDPDGGGVIIIDDPF